MAASESPFNLGGRCALVTGASSGLGAQFARALTRAGARVALAARREDRLAALAAELPGSVAVAMDVTRRDSVEAAVTKALAALGKLDILVNNAGIADTQRFLDASEESYRRIMDVNLDGVWRTAQVVARTMADSGGGSIINISSVLGLGVQPTQAAYAASKAAVLHLTKGMARELGKQRIRVNAICPGYFVTEINEAFFATERGAAMAASLFPRRTGKLHELDGALLLLASDAGSYINGTSIVVDGGTLLGSI